MTNKSKKPIDEIKTLSEKYGELALENYARIRRLAELINQGWEDWFGSEKESCFIVPPTGEWEPTDYGHKAFSVYGMPHLPLGPIAFGVAFQVTPTGDYMRFVLAAMKEGEHLTVDIQSGERIKLPLLAEPDEIHPLFEVIHDQMKSMFSLQIDHYLKGDMGLREIGFDFFSKEKIGDNS